MQSFHLKLNNKLHGSVKATMLVSALAIPANTRLSLGVSLYRLIWKLTVCRDKNKLEKMSVLKETKTWLKDTYLWSLSCEISKMSLRDSLAWELGDGVSDSRRCVEKNNLSKGFLLFLSVLLGHQSIQLKCQVSSFSEKETKQEDGKSE